MSGEFVPVGGHVWEERDLFGQLAGVHVSSRKPDPQIHATALDALERARRAQEKHDRRLDVQLRLTTTDGASDETL